MSESVLYIDQGNTRAKFWLCANGQVARQGSCVDAASLQEQLGRVDVAVIVLASVKTTIEAEALIAAWRGGLSRYEQVRVRDDVLPTVYQDPAKLGIDRWLGVLAAKALGAGPALVIDAGTAITFDVLTDQGGHGGGYILPGLALQQASLASQTVRVQFPAADWQGQSLGTDTASAVGHGSIRSLCALAAEVMQELSQQGLPRLYLTGGNARDLSPFLPLAEVRDDLLLVGMQAYLAAISAGITQEQV